MSTSQEGLGLWTHPPDLWNVVGVGLVADDERAGLLQQRCVVIGGNGGALDVVGCRYG